MQKKVGKEFAMESGITWCRGKDFEGEKWEKAVGILDVGQEDNG
jgi:hypothetical protein